MRELRRNGPESRAFSGLNWAWKMIYALVRYNAASSAPTFPHSFGSMLFLARNVN